MDTLIKNGKIVTSGDIYNGDILIEDGIIKAIGTNFGGAIGRIIDASGKIVIPGGIDVHTHLNLHSGSFVASDDFYTGTIAAACGGTTCVVDHMGFGPEGCSLDYQLKAYHDYAEGNAVIDYSFHGVIQHVDEGILEQLESLINLEGIPSFKMYMTYDYMISDEDSFKLLSSLGRIGGITAVHAENNDVIKYLRRKLISEGKTSPVYHALSRPVQCESEAIQRIINIASMCENAPIYIVHLTTLEGLEHIKKARERGQLVFTETCPQYLLLSEEKYKEDSFEGLKYIMSPPLRKREHCNALWGGIAKGTIQVVATDHCPFSFDTEKLLGRDDFTKCPNGAPGIEERIPLMFSEGVMKGRISLNKFVEVCCTNPAKIFGLYPKKGTIAPGSDGDIAIIDPDKEVLLTRGMLHGNADYTVYEGIRLKGYPVMVFSRGEIIVKDNEFLGKRGEGRFIKRKVNLRGNAF